MAGTGSGFTIPELPNSSVLIVEARYHTGINDMLLEGAKAVLEKSRASVEVLSVPGALEIPPSIKIALDHERADAFVALGCVIRGETTHYETVAFDSSRAVMQLGIEQGALIGNGILTVENEEQALVRADPADQDKGGGAAIAALSLLQWRLKLRSELT